MFIALPLTILYPRPTHQISPLHHKLSISDHHLKAIHSSLIGRVDARLEAIGTHDGNDVGQLDFKHTSCKRTQQAARFVCCQHNKYQHVERQIKQCAKNIHEIITGLDAKRFVMLAIKCNGTIDGKCKGISRAHTSQQKPPNVIRETCLPQTHPIRNAQTASINKPHLD
jgi:hypothetical protein